MNIRLSLLPRLGVLTAALAWVLAGCATSPVLDEAQMLALSGRPAQALALIDEAVRRAPDDSRLRQAQLRQRELTLNHLVIQAERERVAGRLDAAASLLNEAAAVDAVHPRIQALRAELDRMRRREVWMVTARQAESGGRHDVAFAMLGRVLEEAPAHPGARALQLRLLEQRGRAPAPTSLGAPFRKSVTVEFREAPLRSVLEGLGRTHGVNFVFDRDVRTDTKVSILLRDVSIADALRVILGTQQLAFKILNESTLLIYPNTQAKQREHQDLVARSFFLANADVKQAQALIRVMTKTRDIYIDERLNQLVVRDTPEILDLVERLLASIDVAEPEVVLEVEVLEVASNRLDEIGLQWPETLQYGLSGFAGSVDVGERGNFRASIANPAVLATLRETTARANTLANPRLRARNREKAKVIVGEKLPVFTTTSTANVGVSASVSYLDVGLKLEVEPSVQLDNDVVMKVNLEVSTLIGRVAGPQGSVGYQVGTRQASTSLRLHDGETQVLAGLIRDEDAKGVIGVPGLSAMPVIGRLFGLHTDQRAKTEIVLLITPRVVRTLAIPDAAVGRTDAGVEANAGVEPLRLAAGAAVGVPPSSGGARAGNVGSVRPAGAEGSPQEERIAALVVATSGQADVGGTAAVTLRNGSTATMQGELVFDATMLQPAQAGASGGGRMAFNLAPGAETAVLLRVTPAAAGQTLQVSVAGLVATDAGGEHVAVQTQGEAVIVIGGRR